MSEINKNEITEITNDYFENGGAKIRRISDSVLRKIGYVPDYPDEYYSLAGEVFLSVIKIWDGKRKFDSLLYTCLLNRFKSLLTKENAQKRGGQDNSDISLSTEIGEDLTLEDTIGENQVIDRISPEMMKYLGTLNDVQKKIYLYLTQGFEPNEIQKKLNISPKIYAREMREARSYDKLKILKAKEQRIEKKGEQPMSEMMRGNNERTDVLKTVSMLIEDVSDGTLRDDNPLQRATDNWNTEMKGNLIVTALNGFGIPEFVICERKVGDAYVKEIIDGLQRFSAFSGYIANGYRISKKVERPFVAYKVWKKDENGNGLLEDGLPVYEDRMFDVRGKKFSDLPRELQKKIEGYGIHCDTYLKCTNEDVEYHIRRLNSSRSMNHSQRGLTFVGSTLAAAIKQISRNTFFRDTYKVTDFRNGNVQRLISESVMLINFPEEWIPSPEKIGSFLSENAEVNHFEEFGELVDRVDEILDDETRKRFNMRDSFLWFRIFSEFTKFGIEDERFNDFLNDFETLKEMEIDGNTFATLTTKNTKGTSVVLAKINYLTSLLYEYFGKEREIEVDLEYGEDVAQFTEDFYAFETEISVSEKNKGKVAIKTAYALKGKEDLSDSAVQEYLNKEELISDDFDDTLAYTQDFIDDWAVNVDHPSSVLKEDKIPALVRLYKYAVDSEVEGSRAQNWFINFADQESVNKRLVGDYRKDFETLKKSFDSFVSYENLGVA